MKFTEVTEEVLYTSELITSVSTEDVELLKEKASGNRRKRVRLCAHSNAEDLVHEMLIVHVDGPQPALGQTPILAETPLIIKKSESIHVIQGTLKVIIFDQSGDISEVIDMGAYSTGRPFFYRISDEYFHTDIPTSEVVVFHETNKGPFRREDIVFAPWAPAQDDTEAQSVYLNKLSERLATIEAGN